MTREQEASPLGSCMSHLRKYCISNTDLLRLNVCVTEMCSFLVPAPALFILYGWYLRLGRVIRITKIPEMCLWWVHFEVTGCSWLIFIPVFVSLCRPKLHGRNLFSLAGEIFNKILGLVTEFRKIQARNKVKIFIRKNTSSGESR